MRYFLLITFTLSSYYSNAAEFIDWYVYDRPPAHFLQGPNKGQGYLDQLLALTIKELPEYKHNIVQATIARGLHEMKMGNNACHLSLFKTQKRALFTEFSVGYMMSPNLQVIISKKLKNSLNLKGKVSIEALFSEHKLKAIKLPQRSYTDRIDKVFKKYSSSIHNRATMSETGLYGMLKNERVDFLIAVPSTANYALGKSASHYDSLAINGMEEYGISYIGCSKTPWGQRVVSKVNKTLFKLRQTKAYLEAMSAWLPEEQVNENYLEYYHNQFLKN